MFMDKTITIEKETKLECLRECRKKEHIYDYITPIHEVEVYHRMYKHNARKRQDVYIGQAYRKYYRAYMKLKAREECGG